MIQDGHRIKRIIVEGYTQDLVQCVAEITKILSKVHSEAEMESAEDLVYKQVGYKSTNEMFYINSDCGQMTVG